MEDSDHKNIPSMEEKQIDIVEFIEKMCNFPLCKYEKKFVMAAYDAYKNNNQFVYVRPRGSNKMRYDILAALVTIIFAQKKGLVKEMK